MAQFDLPLEDLRRYQPRLPVPGDLDAFWASSLAEARDVDEPPALSRVYTGLATVQTYDVTFGGYKGSPVKGWLHLPKGRQAPIPAVVEYVGYGGGRGLAHERTLWAQAGYAHFVMDNRGQGATHSVGDTPDQNSGAPAASGLMTRGILSPVDYYYLRLMTDAVRAIDAVRTHPEIDSTRIAVVGSSQGGGLAIAAAALVPDLSAVAADVPFLCDFPRAVVLVDTDPYAEVGRYLRIHRDQEAIVMATLSYFDVATLARKARAPALVSVGLMDLVTPPSTVFAAYNAYAGPKRIVEYPFNGHEGGQGFQEAEKLAFLARVLRGDPTGASRSSA